MTKLGDFSESPLWVVYKVVIAYCRNPTIRCVYSQSKQSSCPHPTHSRLQVNSWVCPSRTFSLKHMHICQHLYKERDFALHQWNLQGASLPQGQLIGIALASCLTLCPMDCSSPDSSVHGIFQARILEWVATSSSRGSELKPQFCLFLCC